MPGMKVKEITFEKDRVVIEVSYCDFSTPEERERFNEELFRTMPDIMEHDCVNSRGPKFMDCYKTTSLPHVFEHIVIFYLSCLASSEKKVLLVGKTTNTGANVAKIEVKYYDDIQALRAINAAAEKMNSLMTSACEKEN